MAKDGSARGGARIGAGRKSKSLEEKIIEGKFSDRGFSLNAKDIPTPEPKKYISAEQKMGDKTCAEQVYNETYDWLKACGCAEYVTLQLVETYAQMVGRHIQCEQLLSQFGLLAKHPTTGEPVTSFFVKMSLDYLKSANQMWYQIYQIVKEHSKHSFGINNADDMMEHLLRRGVK